MKANELRIWNLVSQNSSYGYVYSIESPLPRKEKRFSDKVVITLFDNGIISIPIDEITPIQLTEEWLLKFGKIEWVNKDIDGFFYWFNGEKKYLKFVHSLQNTYFCIEQKELLCDNI